MSDVTDDRGKRTGGAAPARTVVLLAWLLGVALLCGCAESPPSGPSGAPDGEQRASETAADLGAPALGRKDAPVVLTEYSDYQ